jgi:hypothetical protein
MMPKSGCSKQTLRTRDPTRPCPERYSTKCKTQIRMESVFDLIVQKLKNIRFPFGDAKVEQTVPII